MRFRYPNVVAGSIAASAPIIGLAGDCPRDYFFRHVTAVCTEFQSFSLYIALIAIMS